ncbi:HD domain-containing phosphohydrolase [Paenibacillus sp. TAB 01]|uniref:HD domain-containing phosphohydrolase n=1 Tax=Paenibacillus sp. TAB 01 TaxID=3368988 RepID=UPI003751E43D
MKESHSSQYQYVGFRINKNFYNRNGVLVVPKLSVLTRRDIQYLLHQGIAIKEDDVEQASILHLVNSAINEIKVAFDKVRYLKHIPLNYVHEKIIPVVTVMSEHPDLHHIFTHLKQHDEYTYRHSIGVAIISQLIGRARGIRAQELLELTIAGFLHDIGKVKIPDEIINKPEKLTPDEFHQINQHTVYGFEIMRRTAGITCRQALVALQHHEREDGSGYPYGVNGTIILSFISSSFFRMSAQVSNALSILSSLVGFNDISPINALKWSFNFTKLPPVSLLALTRFRIIYYF